MLWRQGENTQSQSRKCPGSLDLICKVGAPMLKSEYSIKLSYFTEPVHFLVAFYVFSPSIDKPGLLSFLITLLHAEWFPTFFALLNCHRWHSGQSAGHKSRWNVWLPPHRRWSRTAVTSPIALDQLALKYLLVTPLPHTAPFFCDASRWAEKHFFIEWAVETHQCFLLLLLHGPSPLKAQLFWEAASHSASNPTSVSPKPIWSGVEPGCQPPFEQVKYFEVILGWHRPWCGRNYGQSQRAQGTASGRDADNSIEHRVGCFHCHTLSVMETKCSLLPVS